MWIWRQLFRVPTRRNFTKPSIENKFEIPIDNFQKFKLNFFPTESIHPRQTFIRNPPIEKELQVARFQFPHSFFEGNGGNSVEFPSIAPSNSFYKKSMKFEQSKQNVIEMSANNNSEELECDSVLRKRKKKMKKHKYWKAQKKLGSRRKK